MRLLRRYLLPLLQARAGQLPVAGASQEQGANDRRAARHHP